MNVSNIKKVMRRIQKEPAGNFMMHSYHCGSAHCISGWAQVVSGKRARHETADNDAMRFMSLTFKQLWALASTTSWPKKFRSAYSAGDTEDRKRVAIDRIRHFLKTKGRK